ncbi:HAD-IIB family hydrolase [Synechocystis sp. PCC 7338]|uniref:HAD-IIB family hydrolase n=1 Tax=Synechocystis sp. PCC 7338 TaxID=2732530 RepID=UPI001BAF23BB|nr:HAD-IIB family hydrolase [Synechocystis sp. PCC 7338]QUS60943.1 HAD-IIB family hydrolase [Synechocystis sp. PCC 7338]
MSYSSKYILLISIHGLIRGENLELGRDADTGGQTKYVLELTRALVKDPQVARVDLMTRLVKDPRVDEDYAQPKEIIGDRAHIVRIECGPEEYIAKEMLWDYLDNFADHALDYLKEQPKLPDVIHSHYADAGYVGTRLSHQLGIPLVHTGHSLGRSKRTRLLLSGIKADEIESRYNMARRINAEEETLGSAARVITSTHQEIAEQYAQYDYYQPDQMLVIPPGTDLEKFYPPKGDEWESSIVTELCRFLRQPRKPLILALSRPDPRKNIHTLIEAYGQSPELQARANLVIVAGNRDDITDLDMGPREVLTDLLLTIDRYDLYGKVAYPKHNQPEDVYALFRLTALSQGVFTNPALTEPFGLTLIEAAASGVPIVATEDGGPVDIIKNCQNGYLINPLDETDIANKLLSVLNESEQWQILSTRGLEGVKRHYSWHSHVDSYLDAVNALMQQTSVLKRGDLKRRRTLYYNGALVTSLDQNLLGALEGGLPGDRQTLDELLEVLYQHRKNVGFCIATGRRLDSVLKILREYRIPQPDILITSMGTEIYSSPDLIPDQSWRHHIDYLWNRNAIMRLLGKLPGLALQPKEELSAYKISYFYDGAIAPSLEEIRQLLHKGEQTANTIISFGQFLDILPIRASKGYAVRWLSQQWNIPLEHVFTAGGSGADEDMMRGNTLSVVVANRHHEELSNLGEIEPIYFSEKRYAAGILDGLAHYRFFELLDPV